jgi:type IV pilus assembly protein PilW
MKMMQARSERGMTLIELMVAGAAFAVISLAGFAVLSTGQRSAVMNDQTVQIQQNVRLAMDLIARDVRMAGFGSPAAGSLPGCANTINTGDNNPGNDLGPDTIAVMTVFEQVGRLNTAFITGALLDLGAPSGLAIGDVVSLEGAFTGIVGAVGINTVTLGNSVVAPTNYALGAAVVQLKCIKYTVSNNLASPPFQLLREVNGGGPVAVVDGIESLQIAYALDANNDGIIDDQPGGLVGIPNVPDCKDFVPNDSWTSTTCPTQIGAGSQSLALGTTEYLAANVTPSSIRQVRLTVVGRATPPAAGNFPGSCWRDATYTGNAAVQAEDQLLTQPVTCGVTGGIRRRTLMRMVTLRNGTNL